MIVSLCRKLWCPKCWNQLVGKFDVLRYCKDIANLLFWKLWECWASPSKIIVSIWMNISWLSASKKSTSSLTSFYRYIKEISKLVILGNLDMPGHTHLKSQYEFEKHLWCLSTGKKSTPSFMFSLRYCKDIANLLFWLLGACLAMHTQSDTMNV